MVYMDKGVATAPLLSFIKFKEMQPSEPKIYINSAYLTNLMVY